MGAQIMLRTCEGNQTFLFAPPTAFTRSNYLIHATRYHLTVLCTKCPKSNRKCVLHLLKYGFAVYLSRCSTHLRLLLGHSVYYILQCILLKKGISVPALRLLQTVHRREAIKNKEAGDQTKNTVEKLTDRKQ